ncbi:MAG: PspA/IM30 family protein [Desulfatitalea sp.]|nr:PspA/IM30 family protein [Desulfatitalea sp.]NNK01140.1 PspA/IM30 family protein [Desulfatitalea sp.]
MKERIIKRVGRIVSGSFNSIVDAIENAAPETVMAEAVREVDGAIDELRAELGKVVANKHLSNMRLMEANKKHEDLTEKIELALKAKREDLAETAVSQQLDIEAQIPVLEATIKDCSDQEKEMEGYVNALLAKKREMQEELRQYRQSRVESQAADETVDTSTSGSGAGIESRVSQAESAFDRVIEKATGLPGTVGSGDRKSAAQLAELESMAHKNRIQERLAAIKGKMESR